MRKAFPRPRLRTTSFLILLAIAMTPLTLFVLWPHSKALELEMHEVRERHLLLARNLVAALDRYQRDIIATFNHVTDLLDSDLGRERATQILKGLGIRHLAVVEIGDGRLVASAAGTSEDRPVQLQQATLARLAAAARASVIDFTGVMADDDGSPTVFITRRVGDKLQYAAIDTRYFIELAQQVSFGVHGHAVIVDRYGRVLAHPVADWARAMRDLSNNAAVERLKAGETGVETFYSAVFSQPMIAGFASLRGAGWGVMVPQPVSELRAKATDIQRSAFIVMTLGVAIAAVIASLIAKTVLKPLRSLSRAAAELRDGGKPDVRAVSSRLAPREIDDLVRTFNRTVSLLADERARVREHSHALEAEINLRTSMEERIRDQAVHDELTGLPNRRLLTERLTWLPAEVSSAGEGVAVHCLDLNDFKSVNDQLGHAAGDDLLRQVGQRLAGLARQGDLVARLGGDEFAIIQSAVSTARDAHAFAERVVAALSQPYQLGDKTVHGSACVGIAIGSPGACEGTRLLADADMALYEAKARGPCSIAQFDDGMRLAVDFKNAAQSALCQAFERRQLELYFQPQVRTADGALVGLEGLIRWHHPERGLITPDKFLPLIDEMGLALDLGTYVLAAGCQAIRQVIDRTGQCPRLALNLSETQLCRQDLVGLVRAELAAHGLDGRMLELEITERSLVRDSERAAAVLRGLKEQGVSVALDDFGTGYSSFATLRRFPVDRIKLDRSLVRELPEVPEAAGIVRAITQMATSLRLAVLAEGVETEPQLAFLKGEQIAEAQGYLFAKPMPLAALIEWIGARRQSAAA